MVSEEEAKQRRSYYESCTHKMNYIFTVNVKFAERCVRVNIDATRKANAARYINHCCRPNLIPRLVWVDDSERPLVALYAVRDVGIGDELTFSYGDLQNERSKGCEESEGECEERVECKCGAVQCVGLLPLDATVG